MSDCKHPLVVDVSDPRLRATQCNCPQALALQAELAACHSALLAPVHQDPRAKDAEAMLARIAAIVNAHHNGDDGELTPGQSRTIALAAIADVLGEPF